ncbi:alpha-1,6-mannosyltransferase [Krasilnikovia cinnamomea]|uniref:Alpha-1,6-mannosyltransferase n=2 Tax=Krasilnikovia cinnamomea TaxID=349313 RepID=A0A4Q7ZP33_9ACTN|nr:alpha-1,6-mannosyltransferase [Krasilnikovia cinnamomea]
MPRARLVRYTGLAGSLLLALAAQLGGATWPWQPTMTPRTVFAGTDGVLLPLSWLLGTGLLIGAWWLGRTSVPSLRWAYVTAALWAAPLLPVLPLGSYDVYSYACQGYALAAGHDPYAAGVSVLGCPWADAVAPTWRAAPAPYGPVFLLLAAGAAKVGGGLAGTVAVLRVLAVLGVVLVGLCLPVLARRHGVPPERAVWLVLACPLVAVHLVAGAHNDAVMVGLLVAGLAVAAAVGTTLPGSRLDRPAARIGLLASAGVLLGLAVGVKVTAVVVLPFAVLAAVESRPGGRRAGRDAVDSGLGGRRAGRDVVDSGLGGRRAGSDAVESGLGGGMADRAALRALLRPGAVLAAGAAGALAAVSLVAGLGFGWVRNLADSGVSVQWTSPPTAVGLSVSALARVFGADVDAVPVARLLGVAALAAVLAVLWWRARGGGALLGAGLALAATVGLAPVFHPWYLVWPLAVLAATAAGGHRWLAAACAVAAALCLPDGYNLALATRVQGAFAVTALLVVMLVVPLVRARRRVPVRTGS